MGVGRKVHICVDVRGPPQTSAPSFHLYNHINRSIYTHSTLHTILDVNYATTKEYNVSCENLENSFG